jgi:folate-binding protein YgfZ
MNTFTILAPIFFLVAASEGLQVELPCELHSNFVFLRAVAVDVHAGDLISSRARYSQYRYFYGLIEGSEATDQIPMEANMDFLNYISYSKGCYIGQELIARTKYKVRCSRILSVLSRHTVCWFET